MIECKVQRDRAAERNTEKIATLDAHCIKQSMQVRGMPERFVVPGNRLAAATQVIADGACVQAEFRHHPVPGPPVAREAMQHHERRRTLAAYFRSEEHTSELQSLMRTSYAVFCLKKKKK